MQQNDSNQFDMTKARNIILLSMGSLIFFIYAGSIGGMRLWESRSQLSNQEEVQGVSNSVEELQPILESQPTARDLPAVKIALNNSVEGRGVVEMHLDKPLPITEAVLEFKVDGDLVVEEIVCSSNFVCQQVHFDGETVAVYARAVNIDQPTVLRGKVAVATIVYQSGTSAELLLNSEDQKSGVVAKFKSGNQISEDIQYLAIGQRNF